MLGAHGAQENVRQAGHGHRVLVGAPRMMPASQGLGRPTRLQVKGMPELRQSEDFANPMERAEPLHANGANRGTSGRLPAAPCPAACGRPVMLVTSACGWNRDIIKIHVILFIFISGNIADTQWILVLVSTPFVVLTLYLINATFGALAPGVAVTLRRYRLPTELTRGEGPG